MVNDVTRRRKLLPWWMIAFVWIFMILGAFGMLAAAWETILSPLGVGFDKEIYGMQTYETFSLLAIFIKLIIIFKGVTAFGMWTEKNWAINFGIADAIVGILVCVVMMFVEPLIEIVNGSFMLNFRFELILLIPYLIKCLRIRKPWKNMPEAAPVAMQPATPPQTAKQVDELPETKDEKPTDQPEPEEKIDKEDPRRFMPS